MDVSATILPAEACPFGGDRLWSAQLEGMAADRCFLRGAPNTLDEWVLESGTLAAPIWCAKYMQDSVAEILPTQPNQSTRRIATPTVDLRINIAINHQELLLAGDGSTVFPELESWQTDLGLEWHRFSENVGNRLGGISRFAFDSADRIGRTSMPISLLLRATVRMKLWKSSLTSQLAIK